MKTSIDVLNLEWVHYPSRDRNMATLVCNYLRFMGYKVIEGSIFKGRSFLFQFKPKLLFVSNVVGSDVNFELVKYAKSKGILIISLISEGNFKDTSSFMNAFIWGWNSDRKIYENFHLQWTERTRNLTLKYYPEFIDKIKVSGGVGFDIYKMAVKTNKDVILRKYNKNKYKKIIGIGCFDFGSFYPDDKRYNINLGIFSFDEIMRFRNDHESFNDILKMAVNKNTDILFLLKEHPGCLLRKKASGIEGVENFENVLIIKNELSIIDCINISDFWAVYDSTTTLEAWLLNKQTCLINSNGVDFLRDKLYLGSPNYGSFEELQKAIDNFYFKGYLPGFSNLDAKRKQLIQEVIQWDDGLNHIRAGNEIINLLKAEKNNKSIKETFKDKIVRYKQFFYWYFSPYLSFTKMKRFNNESILKWREKGDEELKVYQENLFKLQCDFYKKNNLTKEKLLQIKCI